MEIVTEPQSWVLIGVFASIMLGGMTLMTTFITRAMNAAIGGLDAKIDAKIDGLRAEMNARFEAVDTRFDAMAATIDARFEAVDARFEAVNARIDHLDRDVTAIIRRTWGDPAAD
ncbi:MAG: hypothetical protein QM677_07860 [Microbacterium sp.]